MSTFSPQDGFSRKRIVKDRFSYFVSILLFLIGHLMTASQWNLLLRDPGLHYIRKQEENVKSMYNYAIRNGRISSI